MGAAYHLIAVIAPGWRGPEIADIMALHIPFDTTYAHLPAHFFARLQPNLVPAPRLIRLNVALAGELGLDPDELAGEDGVQALAGNVVPDGAAFIALGYAGHQFGHFTPQLGDGRAILLGEVTGPDGLRRDIQLKGSGPTPYSRRGDGRAALGPVLREYIVSEAMNALGVPTTRSLAAVSTGEFVYRETALPGAVLARVAASHIRVGTFQYFAARGDIAGLRQLADYAIARHYPAAVGSPQPYRAFLEAVASRQASLIAQWLLIGFIHGVMNTDNMSIAGETIDYGPCAFLDTYDPATVLSAIDQGGRYAYANQPRIAHWNLTRLAEALLPLLSDNEDTAVTTAREALSGFGPQFQSAYLGGLRRKLGLSTEREGDAELAQDLLDRMAEHGADFTLTFRRLCDAAMSAETDDGVRALFAEPASYDAWAARWRQRLADEPMPQAARRQAMRAVNPAVIPRNHMVEAAILAAVQHEDFAPFEDLLAATAHPYEELPQFERFRVPPLPDQRVLQTFCGT